MSLFLIYLYPVKILLGKVLKEDLKRDNRTIIEAGTVLDYRHRKIFLGIGLITIATLCDDLGELAFRKNQKVVDFD